MGCRIAAFYVGAWGSQGIFLRNASGKRILDPFYPPPVCLFRPDTSGEEKRDMVEPGKEGLKVAPDTSVEEEEENSGSGRGKTLDSKLSMAPKKKPSSSNLLLSSSLKNGEGRSPSRNDNALPQSFFPLPQSCQWDVIFTGSGYRYSKSFYIGFIWNFEF